MITTYDIVSQKIFLSQYNNPVPPFKKIREVKRIFTGGYVFQKEYVVSHVQ